MPDAGSPSAEARDAVADRQLLEPMARAALAEGTPDSTVGAFREILVDGDVATVVLATRMGGYPGWVWIVSIALAEGAEPSVLESGLAPSDGALLAPEWVPWSDRLEEYLAHQAEGEHDDGDDESDDDHDEDDLDPDDDVDGVDIDEHAPDIADDADDDDADDADDADVDFDSEATGR